MMKGEDKQRRNFIKKSTFSVLASLLGMDIVFADKIPNDYQPIWFQENESLKSLGKDLDLTVLNDRPWNVETPAHLLDDNVTPASKMFIRNNGLLPEKVNIQDWSLTIQGESVKQAKSYSMTELKNRFKTYAYHLVLECGGNGRGEFYPPTEGNQWGVGAVSCAKWTGVRLKDVLEDVGIENDAVYIGYHGMDTHLSGNSNLEAISRGIPIWKALQDETLLAYGMNDGEIPMAHGYPLRLVAGGFPASVSGKWLKSISVRNKVHDGAKMEAPSYRIPKEPMEPGTAYSEQDMEIIESMPVRSIITYPKSGAQLNLGRSLNIKGHAWAGENSVKEIAYSIDFGSIWFECQLEAPVNRFAWQHFKATISFPKKGYYEVWVRATDDQGVSQPMVVPTWNPKGYLNNACHRIAVMLT
jgi:sulfite oxidase